MNAFLSVQLFKIPISNLRDIEDYNLIMWEGSFSEEFLKHSQPDIYNMAKSQGRIHYMKDTGKSTLAVRLGFYRPGTIELARNGKSSALTWLDWWKDNYPVVNPWLGVQYDCVRTTKNVLQF